MVPPPGTMGKNRPFLTLRVDFKGEFKTKSKKVSHVLDHISPMVLLCLLGRWHQAIQSLDRHS